jgi:hypothetical protein
MHNYLVFIFPRKELRSCLVSDVPMIRENDFKIIFMKIFTKTET